MKNRVICCGNIAFDLIQKAEDNKGSMAFSAWPGGSVFNTAVILARLGPSVSMISKTGDDFLSDSLIRTMRRENIQTKYVIRDKNIKTGLAFARIDKKGNSSYFFYKTKGPQTLFKKNDVPLSLFKDSDVFHTGSWYAYNDYTFEDTLNFLKNAVKENVFTTFDPNWREGRIKNKKTARSRINKILPLVGLLNLSDTDVTGIFETKTLSGGLKKLGKNAVITLGDKGSFYWDGKKKIEQPAFKVSIKDTIGAGDSFTAGLIYRYCALGKESFWENMKENLAFASALSALICMKHGATDGLKNLNQVKSFLKTRSG